MKIKSLFPPVYLIMWLKGLNEELYVKMLYYLKVCKIFYLDFFFLKNLNVRNFQVLMVLTKDIH